MRCLGRVVVLLGVIAVAAPADAHASRTSPRNCRPGALSTCAAVSVSTVGSHLSVQVGNLPGQGGGTSSGSWVSLAGGGRPAPMAYVVDEPIDPCTVPGIAVVTDPTCSPTTVTPEPVTMTLFATGLVGMGLVRRRRRQAGTA